MRSTPTDRLWTAQDVADYLGVPKTTVYRWRCMGSPCPPGVLIGRHLRFDPAEVRDWVASRADEFRGAR